MDSPTDTRAVLGPPRLRDRIIRHASASITVPGTLATDVLGAGHRAARFFPTGLRVTYSRDCLHPFGPWDVIAVLSGPIERADGSAGSRTATATYVRDADDEPQGWPGWLLDAVSTMHPENHKGACS
jgi:hypothetical protein